MRRKVRNIFHIDMDATLPEILTETIHFETLVINFRVLRSTGFTHDPPFVFEPDYTGTLVAWVVGIDDPRVHISPNHFYMDRESLILTLVNERAHTVLKLNGHPGGIHVVNNPANGVPTMGRDDALKKRVLLRVADGSAAAHDLTRGPGSLMKRSMGSDPGNFWSDTNGEKRRPTACFQHLAARRHHDSRRGRPRY